MKNTFLTLLLAGAGSAVMAQDSTMQQTNTQQGNTQQGSTQQSTMQQGNMQQQSNQQGTQSGSWNNSNWNNSANRPATGMNDQVETMRSNSAYSAYGAATSVPSNIQTNFTRDYPAVSGATWSQNAEYYRASYQSNGRTTHVFYDSRGNSWSLALPKTVGFVPEDVVSGAISRYGNSLYSLTPMKAANGDLIYGITLIDGGASRMEYVGADGASITDIYRVDSTDQMNGAPANNTNMDWQRTGTQPTNMDNATMSTDSSMNTEGTTQQDSTMQYQPPVNNESGIPAPQPEQEYNADPAYGVLRNEEEENNY